MLIIGLVLILVAAALGFGAVYDGGESATVEVFGATVDTTVGGVFLSGAATMLLLLVGLWLLTSSMGRSRRKRVERKEVKQRHRDSVSRLEDERTQLRAENERLSERLGQSGPAADRERIAAAGRQEPHPESATTTGHGLDTRAGDDRGTRVDPPAGAGSGNAAGSPTGVDHPGERGAHARSETDLRDAERTSASGSQEGRP